MHSDLSGPFRPGAGGSVYYLLYIDDCTRYTEVYFLKSKAADEIVPRFAEYKAWVENQGYRIKPFRCDNGCGEFSNDEFQGLLGLSGITYEPVPPYSQHKNGVSERMIQTINTKARCMLLFSELGMRFWAEAVRTAVYLHRHSPTSSLPDAKSPYQMLYGSRPPLHYLHCFGCTVYRHIPKEQRQGKFADWGRACMMLGYIHNTSKIWRVWDFTGRGRAVDSLNVVFVEEENAVSPLSSQEPLEPSDLAFPGSLVPTLAAPPDMSDCTQPAERLAVQNTLSPQGSYTQQGMGPPVGNEYRPESQQSMYLPTLGDELGPLRV